MCSLEYFNVGSNLDEIHKQFLQDGFIVINNCFDVNIIETAFLQGEQNFKELNETIHNKNLNFGIGIKEGFKEIVQRHPLRFEMPYKMDEKVFDFVLTNTWLMLLITKILGQETTVVNQSYIVSLAGAKDQAWHTDGPHLDILAHQPCHCLNIFIPLVDINMLNGPTEFRPASHFITRDFARLFLASYVSKRLRSPVIPCLSRGSLLIFDYRILHRGRANNSLDPRPLIAVTIGKSWFKDVLNFPKRSTEESAGVENS